MPISFFIKTLLVIAIPFGVYFFLKERRRRKILQVFKKQGNRLINTLSMKKWEVEMYRDLDSIKLNYKNFNPYDLKFIYRLKNNNKEKIEVHPSSGLPYTSFNTSYKDRFLRYWVIKIFSDEIKNNHSNLDQPFIELTKVDLGCLDEAIDTADNFIDLRSQYSDLNIYKVIKKMNYMFEEEYRS